jgi:phosphohistidine phosphatase
MKQIIFMRHAKALKDTSNGDFYRELDDRSKKDLAFMAQEFKNTNFSIDKIIASPSQRTKKTAQIFCKELKLNTSIIDLDSSIYEAGISDLMHVIREQDDNLHSILIVGHNPSITSIIGFLTPTFAEHVPTSGIVVVEFKDKTWKLVQSKNGKVTWFKNPKGLSLV